MEKTNRRKAKRSAAKVQFEESLEAKNDEKDRQKVASMLQEQRQEVAASDLLVAERNDYDTDGDEEDEVAYMMRDDYDELTVNAEDERALERFMPSDAKERRTLADIIMQKLQEKEDKEAAAAAEEQEYGGPQSPGHRSVYECGKAAK